MKEFGIALASHKLLVVACDPLAAINAVDPSAYPYASNALAYLMGGGQVIFHDTEVCSPKLTVGLSRSSYISITYRVVAGCGGGDPQVCLNLPRHGGRGRGDPKVCSVDRGHDCVFESKQPVFFLQRCIDHARIVILRSGPTEDRAIRSATRELVNAGGATHALRRRSTF